MNLNAKNNNENDEVENVKPLGNEEISSILQTQSKAVFEEKNFSNQTNFVKKSLIEIALDFEKKTENDDVNDDLNSSDNTDINESEVSSYENNDTIATKDDHSNEVDDNTPSLNSENLSEDLKKNPEANKIGENFEDNLNNDFSNSSSVEKTSFENDDKIKTETDEISVDEEIKSETENDVVNNNTEIKKEETQQALESVRDAVSKSIIKDDIVLDDNTEDNICNLEDPFDTISKDFAKFQSIFSNLSEIGETALNEMVQNKIIEIAYDLAGYQIDKMPEKYEKKIKSLLKNINCFEDKITIEVNEHDHKALSKIDKLSKGLDFSLFIPNEELSRGDIILNCDGMHYSEKNLKKI